LKGLIAEMAPSVADRFTFPKLGKVEKTEKVE
jgi:hypothetical protein